jgi:nucleoside-diphosphate-sugar epimerase
VSSVAVTGGTGFIGRAAVDALRAAGHDVTVFGRSCDDTSPRRRRVDLLDAASVTAAVRSEKPTCLVHLAWDVSHGDYWHSEMNDVWSQATIHLAEVFAAQGGRRFIAAGTCAERAPALSATPYARSKDRARQAIAEIDGLELVWIRIFFPVGAHEEPRRLVPSLVRCLSAGERFLVREPSLVRDFCSVDDVGRAFAAATDGGGPGTYEVGTGIGTALRDAAETVAMMMDRSELLDFGAASSPDPLVASISAFKDRFGWTAMIPTHDALARAVDWWKDRQ